jgi:hypothetical protein
VTSRRAALAAVLLVACAARQVIVQDPPGPVPDRRALAVPDSLRAALATDPDSALPVLVDWLTADVVDESARARVIHDWVADNVAYDVTAYLGNDAGSAEVASVLRGGRSACAGFANLYETMCRLAGLECVTVTGYARGYGFHAFGDEDPGSKNHAWNAVLVDGRWRLVDATWSAGHIAGREFIKDYNDDYFFTDAAAFIYTHFPAEPEWQLLPAPVAESAFRDLPFLHARFFRLGLRLLTPLARQNLAADSAVIELAVPDSVALTARLTAADSAPQAVEIARGAGFARIDLVFPEPGRLRVDVFAKPGRPSGVFDGVASFAFINLAVPP